MDLCLKVIDSEGKTAAVSRGEDEVHLVYNKEYHPGDKLILEIPKKNIYVWLQFDDALGESLIYLTGNVTYVIPEYNQRINISPKAFFGERHLLSAKVAEEYEVNSYRNLAINVCDQHGMKCCYPHAVANVETRKEAVFAAQNAIDGVTINSCHGEWPYQSWGINQQEDAKIRIDFGRYVEVDTIVLYTRADFPHDNWWTNVNFTFSDNSTLEMKLKKSSKFHKHVFETKKIKWLEMHNMIKSDDPSPFPALTQIKVFGK